MNASFSIAGPANRTLLAELNYKLLSKLQRGKTTEQDVKMLLGVPTSLDSYGTQSEWLYKTGKALLRIKFGVDHTLSAYEYSGPNTDKTAPMDARQVKSLTAGTTDADLVRMLGEPTYVSMSPSGKEFHYQNTQTSTTFRVTIDEKAGLVTNYLFLEKGQQSPSIEGENLLRIDKGKTSPSDITTLFGAPTQRIIEKDKETWYYRSAGAQLVITFSKSDNQTVSAYQYVQK